MADFPFPTPTPVTESHFLDVPLGNYNLMCARSEDGQREERARGLVFRPSPSPDTLR